MKVSLTDNVTKKLVDVLEPQLSQAKELRFGVAFVKYSGFSLIERSINMCLENRGRVEFLVGLDFRTTEPKVLRTLCMISKWGNLNIFCFSDPSTNDTPVYHPKIYLVRKGNDALISIGSSNLTAGGLRDNIEVNTIIEANAKEEIVSDAYEIYNRLKFQKGRFEPSLDYIAEYEEAYKSIQKKSSGVFRERQIKERIKELKIIEKTLPKPKPTKTELFGWQKLVFEKLPDGIFNTSDMYAYEEEFRQHYPENRHIRDKIRQILQQLRDLGLLRHISENRWEKV